LPAAFTLVEALVAITITAIAASAVLLGITSSLQTTSEAKDRAIALGMAQQLLDEIVGTCCSGGVAAAAGSRASFDSIDDYDGFESRPPKDCWGVELGSGDGEGGLRHPNFQTPPGFFDHWQQRVDVHRVDDSYVVEVRITYVDPDRGPRELAMLQRVIPDVPE
jgi:type II secretory pathway pseudopilin PulG